VIFHVFALPLLRLLGGEPAEVAFAPRRALVAELAAPLASMPGRADYVRVALETRADGTVLAHPVAGGSGDIVGFIRADGLVRIADHATGLAAGDRITVDLIA
jgi:molybdopterin molybdotransferase